MWNIKPQSASCVEADEDVEDVIREGRAFVKAETRRLKRKYYGEEDDDFYDDDQDEDYKEGDEFVEEQEYRDGKPVCYYGAECYRKNPGKISWRLLNSYDYNRSHQEFLAPRKERSKEGNKEAISRVLIVS